MINNLCADDHKLISNHIYLHIKVTEDYLVISLILSKSIQSEILLHLHPDSHCQLFPVGRHQQPVKPKHTHIKHIM